MKIKSILAALVALLSAGAAFAQNKVVSTHSTGSGTGATTAKSKTLVVYYSRTDENYSVGNITEGNTAVIAKMIAKALRQAQGADTTDIYEIKTAKPYPKNYKECTDVAKKEQRENARPAMVVEPVETQGGPLDLSAYDTIFLGYPIWWGDLPMCVYTWLEANDLSGKKIVPFCTHEGSGLSGTPSSLKAKLKGATVEQNALAVRGTTAQNKRTDAQKSVDAWLKKIGF